MLARAAKMPEWYARGDTSWRRALFLLVNMHLRRRFLTITYQGETPPRWAHAVMLVREQAHRVHGRAGAIRTREIFRYIADNEEVLRAVEVLTANYETAVSAAKPMRAFLSTQIPERAKPTKAELLARKLRRAENALKKHQAKLAKEERHVARLFKEIAKLRRSVARQDSAAVLARKAG